MAYANADADALVAAVRRLNPDGRGSVTDQEAAKEAGLNLSDEDLFALIQDLINRNPPRLQAYREGQDPGWRMLQLP